MVPVEHTDVEDAPGGQILVVRHPRVPGAALSFNLNKMRKTRAIYLDAIRDWVRKGDESEYAYSAEEARARLPEFTDAIALAHANFHLGRFLWDHGDRNEAMGFLRTATDLNPDSWNFFRQMKNLQHILGSGGPEFIGRVRRAAKAGKSYYPVPDMTAMDLLPK